MPTQTTPKTDDAPRSTASKWMQGLPPIQTDPPPTSPAPPDAPPAPAAPQAAEPPAAAAPAKPEPPAPPAPPTELEGDKMPRTSSDWKKFREARDTKEREYQTKLTEYEKQLKELASKPAAPADYEQTKKQAEEYSTIIQQISVENHPKFKAYYEGMVNRQVELAKNIVGKELSDQAAEILSLPDGSAKNEKIDELFGSLTPSQQARMGGVVNQLSIIHSEKQNEIAKSKDTYAAMQNQKQQEQQATVKKYETVFDSEIKRLQTESPAYQKREGDEAWNAEVDQRIATAKDYIFGNAKPEQLIRAATEAAAFPAILKQNLGLMEEVTALKNQIKEMSSASPRVTTDRTPEAPANSGERQVSKAPAAGSRPMDVMANKWMKDLPQLGR